MAESIQQQIKTKLQAAEELYHRLVLLVGETGSGKSTVLRKVANEFGTSIVNVNLSLSSVLLEMTTKQRKTHLQKTLDQITHTNSKLILLDNLEILFDKKLEQDPLRLLQSISRNRTVVASWNGILHADKLVYADIGHPEYRSYETSDILIIEMPQPALSNLTEL